MALYTQNSRSGNEVKVAVKRSEYTPDHVQYQISPKPF